MAKIIGISSDIVVVDFGTQNIPPIGAILESEAGSILSVGISLNDTLAKTLILKLAIVIAIY